MQERFFEIDGKQYEFIGVTTDLNGKTIDIFIDKNGNIHKAPRAVLEKKFKNNSFKWLKC